MAAAKRKMKTPRTLHKVVKREGFVDLLNKLEGEIEKIVGRVTEVMNHSSREVKDRIQDLVDKVRLDGFYNVATEKKDEWEKEIKRLAEDIVDRAKEFEFLPIESFNRDKLIGEAKKNISDLLVRLNESDFLAKAKVSADKTKAQVLSFLRTPSTQEVDKLSKRIKVLENRIGHLSKKAA